MMHTLDNNSALHKKIEDQFNETVQQKAKITEI